MTTTEINPDMSDRSRCISVHWSLPVQCVLPCTHRENWHEAWDPETGNRLRYRRSFGTYATEELRNDEWTALFISPPSDMVEVDRADLERLNKHHDELRDKRTDLLNIRGILSPQDRSPGLGPVVPMPLGKEVAPAVEWLVNEVDQLREENLQLRGIKSAPDVWGDARPLTDNERTFQDGV